MSPSADAHPASSSPLHLIVPFAGRSTPACQAALPGLKLPNLAALLARLPEAAADVQEEQSLTPPHERARAAALGLPPAADGTLPWAAQAARRAGLPGATDQAWAWVTLCHWQAGMSEVVLIDPSHLGVQPAESQALLAAVRPFFEEDDIHLFATDAPGTWLASGPVFDQLPTASLDRAIGQPLEAWLPMADGARTLRRLQNEMQMLLYNHPVNDARGERRQLLVNSLWFSGTGRAAVVHPQAAEPAVDERLRPAALDDHGEAWAAAWAALDAGPIAQWLARSRAGEPVTLTLCGDRTARRYQGQRGLLQRWLQRTPDVATVLESL